MWKLFDNILNIRLLTYAGTALFIVYYKFKIALLFRLSRRVSLDSNSLRIQNILYYYEYKKKSRTRPPRSHS